MEDKAGGELICAIAALKMYSVHTPITSMFVFL